MKKLLLLVLLACCAPLVGCFKTSEVLSGGDSALHGDGGPAGSGGGTGARPEGCSRGGVCTEIEVTNIDKVDLLFAIDNSSSMAEEQAALTEQFPRLLQRLTTGDRDGDGEQDFPPAKDVHLGVVSSDLGTVGISDYEGCSRLGDDGVLQNRPRLGSCKASYPPFLVYNAGINTSLDVAQDFACIATLGTAGCGFEQPLDSALKALWPGADDRITFLADTNGGGARGHGDAENAGFLRNDPVMGRSLIAVVVVSDDDDCSHLDSSFLRPPTQLDPSVPSDAQLLEQGPNARCGLNPDKLFPTSRYVDALRALRADSEELVVFAAIVGVPPATVGADVLAITDFNSADDRAEFYDRIANHQAMQPVLDDRGTPDVLDDRMRPSCETSHGPAFPPHRIVEVAKGFGANGIVQSSCEDDYAPAIDAIVNRIAPNLGSTCLDQGLGRNSSQLVACDVIWELPPAGHAVVGTPTRCDAASHEFLLPPRGGATRTDQGGARCRVAQLPTRQAGVGGVGVVPWPNDDGITEGWYYDDFSEEIEHECKAGARSRITFTPSARPPTGVRVLLDCAPDAGL